MVEATRPHSTGGGYVNALERVDEDARMHQWPDLMEPELELGNDAEAAAAASERPKQILVLVLAGADGLTRGGDDLRRDQAVDREPSRSARASHPAAAALSPAIRCSAARYVARFAAASFSPLRLYSAYA